MPSHLALDGRDQDEGAVDDEVVASRQGDVDRLEVQRLSALLVTVESATVAERDGRFYGLPAITHLLRQLLGALEHGECGDDIVPGDANDHPASTKGSRHASPIPQRLRQGLALPEKLFRAVHVQTAAENATPQQREPEVVERIHLR